MAQPLGVAVAAATIAVTADRAGVQAALWIPVVAVTLALGAVFLIVLDPPRPTATPALTANPYRADGFLMWVHDVSVLLVVPQFLVWTFSLTWLVNERHWSAAAAGALVAVTHVLGALGRIAVGQLSDMVGSRVRPLRWVAVRAGVTMALLGLTEPLPIAVVLMVVASTVTVADNGLAFTSVAERAGSYWSGRALGVQNTAQYLTRGGGRACRRPGDQPVGVRRGVRSHRTVPMWLPWHWCPARMSPPHDPPHDPPVTDTGGRSLHC